MSVGVCHRMWWHTPRRHQHEATDSSAIRGVCHRMWWHTPRRHQHEASDSSAIRGVCHHMLWHTPRRHQHQPSDSSAAAVFALAVRARRGGYAGASPPHARHYTSGRFGSFPMYAKSMMWLTLTSNIKELGTCQLNQTQ